MVVWEIVREFYEKGISGYKVKTENGVCEKTFVEAPDGRMMFALRFIVSTTDGSAKIYEYGGIGNCSDIMVEASMMAQRTIR